MDKILIVDSSVVNTDLMSECLNSSQYEVMTAESGFNAISKIDAYKPDLVILECELPDVSGYDICKKIKASPETKYMLVLMMSQSDSKEIRMRAIQVGADDFMEKTFDTFIFLSKIKSLLRLKYLSEQLKQKYMELEEKNSILEFQLKMAKSVQRSMMPKETQMFNGIEFYSKYMPALDIGGDFYNIIELNSECISVVMGDVSGHGIAAALLTSMINSMVKNLVLKYHNPDQLLYFLNDEFYKIFENSGNEMFACVFYAVIDTRHKRIFFSNAGESLPIYADAKNNMVYELNSTGLPVGLINNSKYEFKQMNYNEGDILLFHTDGLSDTFYKENPDEFSSKIKEILLDSHTLTDSAEIVDIVLSSFYNYNASENELMELDDVSIILCRL